MEIRNLSELNRMPNTAIRKRITREIKELEQHCIVILDFRFDEKLDTLFISVTENKENTENKYKYKKNNIYLFGINHDYPFVPPKVEINNTPYYSFLTTSPFLSKLLKKTYDIECLCCNAITCRHNWSPALTCYKIILEIRKYKKYRMNIMCKLLTDKIKNKYLINDIDIFSWLKK